MIAALIAPMAVPAIQFGLGAVAVARHPEGAVLQNARQLRLLVSRVAPGREPSSTPAERTAGEEAWLGRPGAAVADAGMTPGGSGSKAQASP